MKNYYLLTIAFIAVLVLVLALPEQKVGKNADLLKVSPPFTIGVFAKSLGGGARDLVFSPEGILLTSIPSSGKVVALPDKNGDGVADETKDTLVDLDGPHGLAFFEGKLYVAEKTRVARYNWDGAMLKASLDKVLFSLPYINPGHSTRSIAFNEDGEMFISIGSSCDFCFEKEPLLATVIVSDKDGNNPTLFAKGLRNTVFIAVNPQTQELWGTEMGRDYLGDDLPPDEINILRKGSDYGWPNCYGNKVFDIQFNPSGNPDICIGTEKPAYETAAHSAPLGLAFIDSKQFPGDWQNDLLVAYHGSWGRAIPNGYKIVRLHISGNEVLGEEDFITGFLPAITRPVDLVFDKYGSLYISDDRGGMVYKVIKKYKPL
ncbi:MAG: PQQ-dependent sugar dehydrogenase [bacterium]|nr:PQQ-dependent sugar dehydrogenase [bacterium]